MPRRCLHSLGISLLASVVLALPSLVLAGCGQGPGSSSPWDSGGAPVVTPRPVPVRTGPPRAAQELSFSGEVSGSLTQLAVIDPGHQNECTGAASRSTGIWASTLYGHVGDGVYGVVVLARPYRGPGTYAPPTVRVEVHTVDTERVWQSGDADTVVFTVDPDQLTGTIDATLHDAATARSVLRIQGTWSCEP